jgi:uncharacterized tellurite resistance protein B-like protein
MSSDAPDKQEMLLAFGFETARSIARADGRVDALEVSSIERHFPRAALLERRLLTDEGPTARFGEAYNLALAKLKTLLSAQEKRALAEAFFEVCRSDAAIDGGEVQAVIAAMAALGVSKADLALLMRDRISRS